MFGTSPAPPQIVPPILASLARDDPISMRWIKPGSTMDKPGEGSGEGKSGRGEKGLYEEPAVLNRIRTKAKHAAGVISRCLRECGFSHVFVT